MPVTKSTLSHGAIVEEIINRLFGLLELEEGFDGDTMERLIKLADSGDLSKPKKVEKAMTAGSGRTQ